MLLHGSSQIVPLALNDHKHFVDLPGIIQVSLSFLEFLSIVLVKLLTPLTNGFVGDDDSGLCTLSINIILV